MAHRVVDWVDVATEGPAWDSIVLGNGFSIGIDERFRYDRLGEAVLNERAKAVLRCCGTQDFEAGLLSLEHALRVHDALVSSVTGESQRAVELAVEVLGINRLRDDLRRALIEAVRCNHPQSSALCSARRHRICRVLEGYPAIFTTTYDLMVYWCLIAGRAKPVDHFRVQDGSPGALRFAMPGRERGAFASRPHLYYLHGALHLRECTDGTNAEKIVAAGQDGSLLRMIERSWDDPGGQPLFVSEGTSVLKRQRIDRSAYLRFANDQLTAPGRHVVIYGASIAEQDAHIWTALDGGADRVAVAVHRDSRSERTPEIEGQLGRARQFFRRVDVEFFWADSHPLHHASRSD